MIPKHVAGRKEQRNTLGIIAVAGMIAGLGWLYSLATGSLVALGCAFVISLITFWLIVMHLLGPRI